MHFHLVTAKQMTIPKKIKISSWNTAAISLLCHDSHDVFASLLSRLHDDGWQSVQDWILIAAYSESNKVKER